MPHPAVSGAYWMPAQLDKLCLVSANIPDFISAKRVQLSSCTAGCAGENSTGLLAPGCHCHLGFASVVSCTPTLLCHLLLPVLSVPSLCTSAVYKQEACLQATISAAPNPICSYSKPLIDLAALLSWVHGCHGVPAQLFSRLWPLLRTWPNYLSCCCSLVSLEKFISSSPAAKWFGLDTFPWRRVCCCHVEEQGQSWFWYFDG